MDGPIAIAVTSTYYSFVELLDSQAFVLGVLINSFQSCEVAVVVMVGWPESKISLTSNVGVQERTASIVLWIMTFCTILINEAF